MRTRPCTRHTHTQGQLRSQLLTQLQRSNLVDLGAQAQAQQQQQQPDLRRRVLNSMLAEYLRAARFDYSLSVFAEESGASSLSSLTHEELMGVLRIDEGSALQQALVKARLARADQPGSCFLLQLLDAVGEVSSSSSSSRAVKGQGRDGVEALTVGGDRYQMDVSGGAARTAAQRCARVAQATIGSAGSHADPCGTCGTYQFRARAGRAVRMVGPCG